MAIVPYALAQYGRNQHDLVPQVGAIMPAFGGSFRNQSLHELVNLVNQLIRGLLAVRHDGSG
jgi:hypothetical protein